MNLICKIEAIVTVNGLCNNCGMHRFAEDNRGFAENRGNSDKETGGRGVGIPLRMHWSVISYLACSLEDRCVLPT